MHLLHSQTSSAIQSQQGKNMAVISCQLSRTFPLQQSQMLWPSLPTAACSNALDFISNCIFNTLNQWFLHMRKERYARHSYQRDLCGLIGVRKFLYLHALKNSFAGAIWITRSTISLMSKSSCGNVSCN